MNFRSKSQRGFTLLEVLLAIGVSLSIGAVALTELRRDNESKQAKAVGQQSAMVGRALNTYLALQYTHIVNLENSPGVGSADDPGPRFCTANVTTVNGIPASICTITTDTLVRSGLLPTSFSGRNAYGAEYDIYIRVVGNSPYIVEGLVVTDQPYTTGGGNRYDLLGQAMQEAGADSGMTRTLANTMEGLNGTWRDNTWPSVTHDGVTYPGVNQLGLLGYRAGYGSSGYAAYLRLDGTTPMTGFLNMSGHDIVNVADLEARTGTFNPSDPNTTPALSLNNTTPNNATNFSVGAGSLAIRNNGGVSFETLDGTGASNVSLGDLTAEGNVDVNGDVGVDGNLQAQDLIATRNASVQGNLSVVGAIQGGSISTSGNGNIVAGGTGTVQGNTVRAVNTLRAGNYTLTNSGLQLSSGPAWFYDSTVTAWRATGAGILTNSQIRGNSLVSDTDVTVAGYLDLTGGVGGSLVTEGAACDSTGYGQVRRTSSTTAPVVTCINGTWRRVGTGNTVTATSATVASPGIGGPIVYATATCPTGARVVGGGYALINFLPLGGGYDGNAPARSEPSGVNAWRIGLTERTGNSTFQATAVCAY